MVVFATPGMLHAGLSLQIFKKWAPFEQNMIIIPGYCVAGTIGHKVLNGQKKIEIENKQIVIWKIQENKHSKYSIIQKVFFSILAWSKTPSGIHVVLRPW